MKVKNLITELSKQNPNAEVFTRSDEGNSVMFVIGNPEKTKVVIGEW